MDVWITQILQISSISPNIREKPTIIPISLKGHLFIISVILSTDGQGLFPTPRILRWRAASWCIFRHLPYHSYWYGSPEVRFLSIGFGIFPDEAQKRYLLQKVELTEETRKLLLDIPLKNPVDCDGVSRLYALLHRLLPQMAYKTKKPTDETVEKARKYMEVDPKLSIAEIARNCGLSESGLYAAFRQQGTTPVEFRQRLLC